VGIHEEFKLQKSNLKLPSLVTLLFFSGRKQTFLKLSKVTSVRPSRVLPFLGVFVRHLDRLRAVITQSVWHWAKGWTIGVLGSDSRRGLGIFLITASRRALGPTQPPIQWVPGALSLGVKRPGREADHLHPSSAEVKEWVELYIHSPNTPSWRGAQLKHRDNFIFTF
jgi:hypothetical protein